MVARLVASKNGQVDRFGGIGTEDDVHWIGNTGKIGDHLPCVKDYLASLYCKPVSRAAGISADICYVVNNPVDNTPGLGKACGCIIKVNYRSIRLKFVISQHRLFLEDF